MEDDDDEGVWETTALLQQQQHHLQVEEDILQERTSSIHQISQHVKMVHQMFSDLANLTEEQQHFLDDLETNVSSSGQLAQEASRDLAAHAPHRPKLCSLLLLLLALLFLLLVKFLYFD